MIDPATIHSIQITARQMARHVPPCAHLDLESEGLLSALTGHYDPARGCALSTFQQHRAIWGMREAVREWYRTREYAERHQHEVVPHPFPEHLRIVIRAMVSMLPTRDQDMIDRYYYQGHTLHEIADHDAVTESAISLRMTAIHQRLRMRWQTMTRYVS